MSGSQDRPQEGVSAWSSNAWQHDVLDWIDARLRERGMRRTGECDITRIRSWSAVFRFPTDQGTFWFKADSQISLHEIRLYPLLARIAPDIVLSPLALDSDRGWIILPDGGTTLIHSASGMDLFNTLVTLIPLYARLQLRLMRHLPLMLELGVPDMRAAIMPQRFDEALNGARSLLLSEPTGQVAILDEVATLRPTYLEMCESLACSMVPSSLDHGDLHANNIFPGTTGTPRIYDWGDSALAHPFATMLLFLRNAATALETGYDDPRLSLLRDAYLNEFRHWGTPGELLDTLEIACRVAMVSRAITWTRSIELGPMPDPSWHKAPFEWLGALRSPSYLGEHTIT
jgi:hypothetical protein